MLTSINPAPRPSPARTSVNTDSVRSSQVLAPGPADDWAVNGMDITGPLQARYGAFDFRGNLAQRERTGQVRQVQLPPLPRGIAAPGAVATAPFGQAKQLLGILRPPGRIFFQARQHHLVQL